MKSSFGFMPGRSTTGATFALRMLMDKYHEKEKELHCASEDLEKIYDRVSMAILWWCMRKMCLIKSVYRWYKKCTKTV